MFVYLRQVIASNSGKELVQVTTTTTTVSLAVIQCNVRDITERHQLLRARAQAEASADLHRASTGTISSRLCLIDHFINARFASAAFKDFTGAR
jgi:hypothetical protein